VGDLARADARELERSLGDWGRRVRALARGEDVREVEAYREAVSYSEENTFGADVSDRAYLDDTAMAHAESVARRLRRDGVRARTVVLKLKLARRTAPGPRGYPLITRRTTLSEPTDDGAVITEVARQLLDRAALEEPVRLLGVGVTNVASPGALQMGLFGEPARRDRRRRLNRALDELSDRFGRDTVHRATQGEAERAGLSHQIKRGEVDRSH
jgi:DNA polymerase-4